MNFHRSNVSGAHKVYCRANCGWLAGNRDVMGWGLVRGLAFTDNCRGCRSLFNSGLWGLVVAGRGVIRPEDCRGGLVISGLWGLVIPGRGNPPLTSTLKTPQRPHQIAGMNYVDVSTCPNSDRHEPGSRRHRAHQGAGPAARAQINLALIRGIAPFYLRTIPRTPH